MPTKTAQYFAFALNEFKFRRISFTAHRTQEAAEASAYKLSGQRRRGAMRDFNGAESAYSDLYPEIKCSREELEAWAKECHYKIDWKNRILLYKGER